MESGQVSGFGNYLSSLVTSEALLMRDDGSSLRGNHVPNTLLPHEHVCVAAAGLERLVEEGASQNRLIDDDAGVAIDPNVRFVCISLDCGKCEYADANAVDQGALGCWRSTHDIHDHEVVRQQRLETRNIARDKGVEKPLVSGKRRFVFSHAHSLILAKINTWVLLQVLTMLPLKE